ncbi:MAG: hypothetical protein WCF93_03725 [Candidatus Moraniibacteriota bacterium]
MTLATDRLADLEATGHKTTCIPVFIVVRNKAAKKIVTKIFEMGKFPHTVQPIISSNMPTKRHLGQTTIIFFDVNCDKKSRFNGCKTMSEAQPICGNSAIIVNCEVGKDENLIRKVTVIILDALKNLVSNFD